HRADDSWAHGRHGGGDARACLSPAPRPNRPRQSSALPPRPRAQASASARSEPPFTAPRSIANRAGEVNRKSAALAVIGMPQSRGNWLLLSVVWALHQPRRELGLLPPRKRGRGRRGATLVLNTLQFDAQISGRNEPCA